MKHVSVVRAALVLGVGVLVGILGLGAISASGAPEGGFDLVQTAAVVHGTTEDGTDFTVELQRTVKRGNAVGWGIGVEFDGEDEFEDFEFDDDAPPASVSVNFNTGRATVKTKVDGCKLNVTWEASGEEFRSDNSHDDGEGTEVAVVKSVKLTDVSGKVCGEEFDTDTVEDSAQIIVEAFYCRGKVGGELTKQECKVLRENIPSAPE